MNNLQRGHFWGRISVERWVNEFFCFCSLFYRRGAAVEEVNPPGRGIKRAVAVVKRWIDVVEEVPNCRILVPTDDGEGKNVLCPTTMPHISSFGSVPCMTNEKASNTHGRYGALNTNSPRKPSNVSGFFLLQM
jgi:hypothetical protein